jgi:hypothetical protein
MTVFVGDVHGKYSAYKRIMKECENSIQVGDMGVGFRRNGGARDGEAHTNPPHGKMIAGGHRFIRGNHDNPTACKNQSQWIPDGTIEGDRMFIGGAVSVDRAWRTEGYDYWADEELSTPELLALTDRYIEARPRVMVTHDCPEELATIMCAQSGRQKLDFPSRSRQAFQSMWSAHSPDLWIFGHWHFSFDAVADGTRFVCLAELEARELA